MKSTAELDAERCEALQALLREMEKHQNPLSDDGMISVRTAFTHAQMGGDKRSESWARRIMHEHFKRLERITKSRSRVFPAWPCVGCGGIEFNIPEDYGRGMKCARCGAEMNERDIFNKKDGEAFLIYLKRIQEDGL